MVYRKIFTKPSPWCGVKSSENVENIYVPLVVSSLENCKMEIADQTVSPPGSIDTWTN